MTMNQRQSNNKKPYFKDTSNSLVELLDLNKKLLIQSLIVRGTR